jgi:hypothetical protein
VTFSFWSVTSKPRTWVRKSIERGSSLQHEAHAEEPADRVLGAELVGGPRRAVVTVVRDQLDEESGGIGEHQELVAEPLAVGELRDAWP